MRVVGRAVPGVHLVEHGEVGHIRIEDRGLDDVSHRRAGSGEHRVEITQRLLGLSLDSVRDVPGRRIDAGRARAEDETAGDDRLAVRAERRGCLLGVHTTSGQASLPRLELSGLDGSGFVLIEARTAR